MLIAYPVQTLPDYDFWWCSVAYSEPCQTSIMELFSENNLA